MTCMIWQIMLYTFMEMILQFQVQLKNENKANSNNNGDGIVIDGYFGDWNGVNKEFDSITKNTNENISLERICCNRKQ